MARAGLAEPQARVVREAVQDTATVIRFQRKVRTLPGQDCWWWTGAISGRGHGRFWLGRVEGRDVVAIAHRFAWALTYGAESLMAVPVLGHRCDNPLCQRIGPGHVEASSAGRNRREWAMRRHTVGAVLRDSRGARGRAQELRDCLRADPTGLSLPGAASTGLRWDSAQLPLWADAGGRASAFGARAGWPQWWVVGEHPSGAAGPRQDRGEQTRTPLLEVSPVDGPATVHRPATRGSQGQPRDSPPCGRPAHARARTRTRSGGGLIVMAAAPGLEPEELVRADNQREAQRLFAAARRHIGAADLGAILAVVAAAHLLDDPMALPPLGDGEGEDLSDLPAVLRATLDRLLAAVPQWRSYLAVPSLLARGHAARELDEALRVLT